MAADTHTHPPPAPSPHSQHIVPEAPLPLGLVEEVVEMAAEGDEHKAEGQEAKNACRGPGCNRALPIPDAGVAVGTRYLPHLGLKDSRVWGESMAGSVCCVLQNKAQRALEPSVEQGARESSLGVNLNSSIQEGPFELLPPSLTPPHTRACAPKPCLVPLAANLHH